MLCVRGVGGGFEGPWKLCRYCIKQLCQIYGTTSKKPQTGAGWLCIPTITNWKAAWQEASCSQVADIRRSSLDLKDLRQNWMCIHCNQSSTLKESQVTFGYLLRPRNVNSDIDLDLDTFKYNFEDKFLWIMMRNGSRSMSLGSLAKTRTRITRSPHQGPIMSIYRIKT